MFFDLDTIVTGNIDDILEYDCPKDLTGLRNFYNPDRFAGGLLSLGVSTINYKIGLVTMPLVLLLALILVRVYISDF